VLKFIPINEETTMFYQGFRIFFSTLKGSGISIGTILFGILSSVGKSSIPFAGSLTSATIFGGSSYINCYFCSSTTYSPPTFS